MERREREKTRLINFNREQRSVADRRHMMDEPGVNVMKASDQRGRR